MAGKNRTSNAMKRSWGQSQNPEITDESKERCDESILGRALPCVCPCGTKQEQSFSTASYCLWCYHTETPQSQIQVLTLQTQRPCIVCNILIYPKFIPVVHKGNTKIQKKDLREMLQIWACRSRLSKGSTVSKGSLMIVLTKFPKFPWKVFGLQQAWIPKLKICSDYYQASKKPNFLFFSSWSSGLKNS